MKTKTKKNHPKGIREEIKSHFAFGEHWNELPEYARYVPEQYRNWRTLKEQFYVSGKYSYDHPLPVNIEKDNHVTVVYLCGFKIPEPAMVVSLGTNATITGRVALCKIMSTKQFVAIAW